MKNIDNRGECPGGDPGRVRRDHGDSGGRPDLRRGRGGQGLVSGERGEGGR